ncbi:MAG: ribosome maturation factor RimP [Acidimicrobiia bacterium]
MSTAVERVQAVVEPILQAMGCELYDIEHSGGVFRITVDRAGGIDLEAITEATRLISRELDHADPVSTAYTLEVSSPGLERRLRKPSHFRLAIGTKVSVRTNPGAEGERRAQGDLIASDDAGFTVRLDDGDGTERRFRYDDVERVRTVFDWGPPERPVSPSKRPAGAANAKKSGAAATRTPSTKPSQKKGAAR